MPQQIPQQSNSLFTNAQMQQMNSNVQPSLFTNAQQQMFQQQQAPMQMPIQQIPQQQIFGAYGRTREGPVAGNNPTIFNDD